MDRKTKPIQTVTAAIIERRGKFLIAKRKAGSHLEGLWEFPGGTVEKDEEPAACIERELKEELGIKAVAIEFFGKSLFNYETKKVRLLAFLVRYISGDFIPYEHEELRWVSAGQLAEYSFAPADLPFVEKLRSAERSG